ncbi:hypothetical protein DD238_005820 [Peronospora effusa]|uniref:tRNA pseudouridine(55) synthase n=1 Tax=Peronospora effusa TaxID=542832 RepID=A0A3M6VG17_9STRA|nr:hypothetical protein DD238_005820 [Peronospora effusa]
MELLIALRAGALSAVALLRARKLGVCMRCCLRFAGIDDLAVYACSKKKMMDAVHMFFKESGVEECKMQEVLGCTCCLGILNEAFHEKMLADVQLLAEKGDYDMKVFSLNIKLPSVVLLREYSLLHFLRSDVDGFPRNKSFDVKDVLKVWRRWIDPDGSPVPVLELTSLLAPSISRMFMNAECAIKSEFAVLIDIRHDESADEVRQIPAIKLNTADLLLSTYTHAFPLQQQLEGTRKRGRGPPPVFDGFGAVSRALATLSVLPETIMSPPTRLATLPRAVVTFERDSVYMQGRYLKFQRGISQTPWILDGERMGKSSVEECIGEIALPFFQGSGYKFHTAGREDIDVRMLGNGRPFILEILDAKKAYLDQSEYDKLQKAVNDANSGAVKIVRVKSSTKDYFAGLQAGADSKKKTYCCVVWSEGVLTPEAIASIDAIHDLTIQQQTPIRVLHRRTQMTRPKVIHAAKCEVLNKHYMLLRLTTSAGTYVKEFVHGDRGRTNPNVASILVKRMQEFELTWVVYDPTDPLGAMLALFALSPLPDDRVRHTRCHAKRLGQHQQVITLEHNAISCGDLISWCWQLVSVLLNKILKKHINQPRPVGAFMSGPGMPSAHSQFISFFAAYMVIYTWKRLNTHRRLEKWLTIIGAIAITVLTCYSRIHLNYHSTDQVAVGAAVGGLTGVVWYALIATVR